MNCTSTLSSIDVGSALLVVSHNKASVAGFLYLHVGRHQNPILIIVVTNVPAPLESP